MKKVGIVMSGLMIVILSVWLGHYIGSKQGQEQKTAANVTEVYQKESKSIAVVNLDEGSSSEKGKEKIFYAERVIQFPDDSFSYTSLEDARQGVENGIYGAYIIIPATFSESVESINVQPKQAQLQYTLSNGLTGDTQAGVLYQVLKFGEVLNADLSYMYLANLLRDFHDAQDGAVTVMDNDLKDKAAIDEIQASDLVEMVNLPDMSREENTTEMLDISPYIDENGTLIDDIDGIYKENAADAKAQLDSIQESGSQFSAGLDELSKSVGEIRLTTDENGLSVYDPEMAALKTHISDYNQGLTNTINNNISSMESLEKRRSEIAKALDVSMGDYKEKLEAEVAGFLTDFHGKMDGVVSGLTYQAADGTLVISCQPITPEDLPPQVMVSIEESPGITQAEKACVDDILQRLKDARSMQELIDININGTAYPRWINKSVSSVFLECNSDPAFMNELPAEYGSAEELYDKYISGGFVSTTELKIEGSFDDLKAYLQQSLSSVDRSTYIPTPYEGNVVEESDDSVVEAAESAVTIPSMLRDYRKMLGDTMAEVSVTNEFSTEKTTEIVNDSYIAPLVNRTESVKTNFQQHYADELTQVEGYREIVDGYSPIMDTSQISENMSKLSVSASQMEQDARENNQAFVEYSNRVSTTAEENVMNLQTHIQEVKEASDQAVENGLSDMKMLKETNSAENQLLMNEFSKKLSYTRLGTMEYTQAYEFLANPLEILQVATKGADEADDSLISGSKPVSAEVAEASDNDYVLWILYGVLGIGTVAVVIGYLIRLRRK